MNHKKQEKHFYDHLFAEGNTVSLYLSGCPALILTRILRVAATNNDNLPDFPDDKNGIPLDYEEEEEIEEVEEITENDLLKYLDQQENPLSIAQRLFYHEVNTLSAQKHEHDWKLKCLPNKFIQISMLMVGHNLTPFLI
ncbi:unnamed protein product [Cunninghamella echinulata]